MCIGFHLHGHSVIIFHHLLSQQATKFGFSYETTTTEERKLSMTRPKKEETLAKTKDVHLRMNETEYNLLAERAKANSMTVSDFVRSALDNQKVIIKYEITADVPEIKKVISEFGKIGSNLNQIARYFNQGGILSSEMKNEIRKSLRDIYEMKYEVMKMAGDFRGSN